MAGYIIVTCGWSFDFSTFLSSEKLDLRALQSGSNCCGKAVSFLAKRIFIILISTFIGNIRA